MLALKEDLDKVKSWGSGYKTDIYKRDGEIIPKAPNIKEYFSTLDLGQFHVPGKLIISNIS